MRFFFICAILVGTSSLFGFSSKEVLKNISAKDKSYLRCFAKRLIENDHASHVIYFDNKPVCIGGCILQGKDKSFDDVLFMRGWHAFKKHKNLFPHPNFLFQEQLSEDNGCCGHYKLLGIYIINKQALVKCLNKHFFLFKTILGEVFDPSQFINKLENGHSLDSLINSDEELLGLLLGYGEESAKSFKEKQTNTNAIPSWTETYSRIKSKQPSGCKICPITFMGNTNSAEVRNLLSTYEDELETFWKYYNNTKNDALVTFLECICKNQ